MFALQWTEGNAHDHVTHEEYHALFHQAPFKYNHCFLVGRLSHAEEVCFRCANFVIKIMFIVLSERRGNCLEGVLLIPAITLEPQPPTC